MNNKNIETMFSSASDEWATPQDFYDKLNGKFKFTLDPCCSPFNAKCDKYFTPKEDGLVQSWEGETVFMNPPYGRQIKFWIEKAFNESKEPGTIVVALLPARTDTRWFHDYIYKKHEFDLLKGRLKFGNCKNSAPFPSMIVIFK